MYRPKKADLSSPYLFAPYLSPKTVYRYNKDRGSPEGLQIKYFILLRGNIYASSDKLAPYCFIIAIMYLKKYFSTLLGTTTVAR